jgi:hypothetical protein
MDIGAFYCGKCIPDGLRSKNIHWILAVTILGTATALSSIAVDNKFIDVYNHKYVDSDWELAYNNRYGFHA